MGEVVEGQLGRSQGRGLAKKILAEFSGEERERKRVGWEKAKPIYRLRKGSSEATA
jgi:hypothetical protein